METHRISRRRKLPSNILELITSCQQRGEGQVVSALSFVWKRTSTDQLNPIDKVLSLVFRRLEGLVVDECDDASQSDDDCFVQPKKRPKHSPNLNYHHEVIRGLEMLRNKLDFAAFSDSAQVIDSFELNSVVLSAQEDNFLFPVVLAKRFVQLGGLNWIFTFLHLRSLEDVLQLRTQGLCLEVLRALCLLDGSTSKRLCEDAVLLNYCFELLLSKDLSPKSASLIEVIFLHRPKTLNLCSLPSLHAVIQNLTGSQLSEFCKVLTLCISELDTFDRQISLREQNLLKRSEELSSVRDLNQELVLSSSNFLPKVLDLAFRKPYLPRYPNVSAEIDHWMRLIDESISSQMTSMRQSVGEFADFCLIKEHLIQRIDALSVLSLLMSGKHRNDVQRKLSLLKISPELSEMFDTFVWKQGRQRASMYIPGHLSSCECSPEMAVKIQFLRLVHGYCDNSEYKFCLLTPVEWQEMKRLIDRRDEVTSKGRDLKLEPSENFEFAADPQLDVSSQISEAELDPEIMCRGNKGLITKIVDVLRKEPVTSTFRFWLSRSIESYLKGLPYLNAAQIFLLRRGLLKTVTTSLLSTDHRHKEILQSSFDLLGELMKYNVECCRLLDDILHSDTKLKRFMDLVNDNLVDSNMFIRAMILAADYFMNRNGADTSSISKLSAYFCGIDKHADYFEKLSDCVRVATLTQENISCLNTALLIVIINHQHDRLGAFLSRVAKRPASRSVLRNFRNLLLFWQEHYLSKDKDCTQLERSSRIPFDFWKSTVSLLVASDYKQTSIFGYVEPRESL